MVFNSLAFFIFFAAVLLAYNLARSWRLQKLVLLLASYLFYASWNPPFVVLLWISTLVDWGAARGIHKARSQTSRRLWLLASLATNLGLLGFFKYAGFLLENFKLLMGALGLAYQPPGLDIFLPIGISFYTFQTLSYTLDVYLGRGQPADSFLDYALFVTFFPQLVAGPIVRAPVLLEQFAQPRRSSGNQMAWGLSLLTLGLFEKMVVADGLLSRVADQVFAASRLGTAGDAWLGALAFSGQIFCDFAGYSSCALGAALCLGFSIPRNFAFPYAAIGLSDFWRRWHISLSSWLRDYLYIPLGGNRKGRVRTLGNIMFTMLLGGLWHGASWTFVIWGGLHGLYLLAERGLKALVGNWRLWGARPMKLLLALITFLLVVLAWVFFRAASLSQALAMLGIMLGGGPPGGQRLIALSEGAVVLGVIAAMLALHWTLRDTTLERVAQRLPAWLLGIALGIMLFLIATMGEVTRAFIYFQF